MQDIGFLAKDASYELKVRSKREKLRSDQANLIKILSQDPEIKTKHISEVYIMSHHLLSIDSKEAHINKYTNQRRTKFLNFTGQEK